KRASQGLGSAAGSRYPQVMPVFRGSTMTHIRRRFWAAVLAMFGLAGLMYAPSLGQTQQGKSNPQANPGNQNQPPQGQPNPKGKDKGGTGKQGSSTQPRGGGNQPSPQPSTTTQPPRGQPLPNLVGGYLGNTGGTNPGVTGLSSAGLQNAFGFQGLGL